ncbi:HTH domain-containing protein, partial [Xanthovirga aplysinae]|uniref:HTH domain-containing protein n=1 Tax=Xanthovirga aplysinae TaxID=2529853 RepID=UPI0012BD71D8
MTFLELAKEILNKEENPLSANEIWRKASEEGLVEELGSNGKTPSATLAAHLYVISRDNPEGPFKTVGKRPKRFYLAKKEYKNLQAYEEGQIIEEEKPKYETKSFLEKDLHPYLAHYAYYHLKCHTKTINHSKSSKKSYGEWVHPDMVGCVFPINEWEEEVLNLSSAIGNTSVKLISFELKRSLNFSTLREKFFQTVSNSSWANESYLVAAEISEEEDFREELSRLSSAFGIGIIQLNLDNPNDSKRLFSAKVKETLDWDTINKLTMNKDFKEFLKRIRIDLKSNEV